MKSLLPLLIAVLVLLLLANLITGPLGGGDWRLVMELRLPRALAAILVGAALAVAGNLMQVSTGNPMASPSLLGLNAGAFLAVVCVGAAWPGIGPLWLAMSALLGAALASALIYATAGMAEGALTPTRLVLAGTAISLLLGALASMVTLYFNLSHDLISWLAGSLQGLFWTDLLVPAVLVMAGLAGAFALASRLDLLALGDHAATGLGLDVQTTRLWCNLAVVMLAGAAVALAGPVGFVGLVVPHMARQLVGDRQGTKMPVVMLLGANLLLLADLIGRNLAAPAEVPVGILTALVGVPVFLWQLRGGRL
ncbi:FecCD family ABC transporter permease [Ferrimonas balearica]|uniref:FecCD family ABC transporter permease n=1 Tax=Ferrimonas balearica TaxID=44012 RepID=UPI002D7EF9DC|nr:iron ABC transporter permease [Ferrimonas balearica]MBY6019589.1 iron ABC transporter permease [Halomonas denitrificans]MBY6096655.1 iron ABC transporter permease [Ferrimonas balearica]